MKPGTVLAPPPSFSLKGLMKPSRCTLTSDNYFFYFFVRNNDMSFFSTVVVNKLFHCSVQHAKQVTEYETESHRKVACVADAKRGGRGGGRGEREKSTKEGKREGSACYKSRCFCNPPTIFSTNPIMLLSIRDQSQVQSFSAWSELNYFVYRKLSSSDAFFK